MKKMKFIMRTMLVIAMGVSLMSNANAQGESLPYNMSVGNPSGDGWVTSPPIGLASHSSHTWSFTRGFDGAITIEKYFDLSGISDIDISYEIDYLYIGSPVPVKFQVYINGVLTNFDETITIDKIDTIAIPADGTFTTNSKVEIVFDYTGITTGTSIDADGIQLRMREFSITGTPWITGVEENESVNNLEVYSSDKSVFITTNKNINANVTVYNTNGQIVYSNDMNISKAKLDLNHLNSGLYIVEISNNDFKTTKKVLIQ